MFNALYREEILEHYKNPLNFGKLKSFDVSSKQLNPFCGDEIEIFVKFQQKSLGVNRKPHPRWTRFNISFVGNGCAICIAATSILTEYAKNKTIEELTKFSEKDMLGLLEVEISEMRKKCALLGFFVLKDCLMFNNEEV